jgi:virginiamycin B lyase
LHSSGLGSAARKACAALLLSLGACAAALAQQGAYDHITNIYIIGGEPELGGMVTTARGAVWFACLHGNQIGEINDMGYIYFYYIPTANSGPLGIALDPEYNVWFTESYTNKIGLIPVRGSAVDFPVPSPESGLNYGITAGPDAAIWFTEGLGNKIGRITTAGVITEYAVPTPLSSPYAITAGPDGALWFTEITANQIGRITTSGAITEYPLGSPGNPTGITSGPDGALWFTESSDTSNRIGRITTAGAVTEYSVLTPDAGLAAITQGPDGALWFTENQASKIGRITTTGVITEYGTAYTHPQSIAGGPDGDIWFAQYGDRIGKAKACGLGLSATFSGDTLTMNFDLGIDTAATLNVILKNASGPIGEPISEPIGPVIPPKPFTREWHNVPNLGSLTVQATLSAGSGHALCSEWTTVNTAP